MLAEGARNPRVGAAVNRYDDAATAAYAAILRRDQDQGQVDVTIDPDAVAGFVGDAVDGLIVRWALTPRRDLEPYAKALKTVLRRSLSSERPTRRR